MFGRASFAAIPESDVMSRLSFFSARGVEMSEAAESKADKSLFPFVWSIMWLLCLSSPTMVDAKDTNGSRCVPDELVDEAKCLCWERVSSSSGDSPNLRKCRMRLVLI
mmetsp:Transcript_2075/g.5493  ORF Transcript_2075/g.5493 Transcript_2075/m.5493 type:complete len:108 (+) Transcript_2075:2774-3097(+)